MKKGFRAIFNVRHGISVGMVVLILWSSSCSQEKIDFNSNDSSNVENETFADAVFSESEDITSATVSSSDATGRIATTAIDIHVNDSRLQCAAITLTIDPASTAQAPRGNIVIDFGTGCTDSSGNTRKGVIRVDYNGRRFLPKSYVVTTLDGYEINGIKIEGVRTVTNTSASNLTSPSFTAVMAGGKVTWPDGTTVLRDEQTKLELKPGATTAANEYWVTGSATGKTRRDVDYSMTITNKLVYKAGCAKQSKIIMPISGTKEFVAESKKMTIDYGDGTCDRSVTITIKSRSTQIELGSN